MDIRLRPLGPGEYDAFVQAARDEYAADIAANGGRAPNEARAKAEADIAALLPAGPATPGQHIEIIVNADTGEAVGRLWFAERGEEGERHIYLYAIEIDEEHRGRGAGRAAMLAFEDEARSLGYDSVKLNVFGTNSRARRLYDSLGYTEIAVEMTKRLSPPRA
ncbi:MAG TPA: GNAT family N-acetyltransferase [Gaiellales bacterium]|nr:GNAT family N-acetyltransferase [Gaiellales bacterium]